MAGLYTAELTVQGIKVSTPYTFGMPRIGNEQFSTWYKSTGTGTFRVVHHKDPVPHLAPNNWGFHHMPYEVFYDGLYNYQDYVVCNYEGEDPNCSDQYAVDMNVGKYIKILFI
jgi:hypothetical protein